MRTDKEKVLAVGRKITAWERYIKDTGTRWGDECAAPPWFDEFIKELKEAIADKQDTAAPNQDSAEPETGAID
jgi:hypothetical protein